VTKLRPSLLQFGKRGREVKIKRSRTLRHPTVKNDGRRKMGGIKRRNSVYMVRAGGGG
jgi:hypothetical protein